MWNGWLEKFSGDEWLAAKCLEVLVSLGLRRGMRSQEPPPLETGTVFFYMRCCFHSNKNTFEVPQLDLDVPYPSFPPSACGPNHKGHVGSAAAQTTRTDVLGGQFDGGNGSTD